LTNLEIEFFGTNFIWMKRRVLFKTTLFHSPLKKRGGNSVVLKCLFPSLSQKPITNKTHAHWPPKMKKQKRQALQTASQPPYPFGVIGQGRVALSPFPLINTRVGRTKKGGDLQDSFWEDMEEFFLEEERERERRGEKDLERGLRERFETEGMI